MRILKEINKPEGKITFFSWNNKYLIKLERGLLEQTFKIPETELSSTDELDEILSPDFLAKVDKRFKEMQEDLTNALLSL